MTDNKIAYTVEEAATVSGVGMNTLRKLIDWKKLPALRVGRRIIIRHETLDKFLSVNEGLDLLDKDKVKELN